MSTDDKERQNEQRQMATAALEQPFAVAVRGHGSDSGLRNLEAFEMIPSFFHDTLALGFKQLSYMRDSSEMELRLTEDWSVILCGETTPMQWKTATLMVLGWLGNEDPKDAKRAGMLIMASYKAHEFLKTLANEHGK